MYSPNRLTPRSVLSAPILVKWTGASGHVYEFELDVIGTHYQPRPGVYITCHFGERNGLVADYLGDADDFSRRISGDLSRHRDWEIIRAAGSTHICTLHVPGRAAQRVRVETDLRRAIMPRKGRLAA